MLKQTRLQDITLPCWIYDQDLDTQLGSNRAAEIWGDIDKVIHAERDFIKSELSKEGLAFFGRPKVFIAYKVREKVFFQCLADLAVKEVEQEIQNTEQDIIKERELHEQTQEKLRVHSAKLNAIFDSTALFIWTMRPDGMLTSYNKRLEEQMYTWFERTLIIGADMIIDPYEKNINEWVRFQQIMQECLNCKKKHVQLELYTRDDKQVWVEIFLDPIYNKDQSEVVEISCIGFEITEQIKHSAEITQSLKEKDTLLKEVHHRVKNNLQIISSLLSLQSKVVSDPTVIDILQESQNRVRSMSYIHESLYSNNSFAEVELNDYLRGLCSSLVQSYGITGNRVEISLEVDDISLGLDQAIPCGLILNELISNALKYAHPDGQEGLIKIEIREKDGRMAMLIADDGQGIPADWNVEEADSLGIQLVYTLTEQLDGEIELSTERGTKYLITFDRIKTSRK